MKRLPCLAIALPCLVIGMTVLLSAPAATGPKRKLVTNLETVEGAMLKHLVDEPDPAKQQAQMESFVAKYPAHDSATWIYGELQGIYLKTGQFDKAIAAGTAVLAKDPDDMVMANGNLKAAEGAKNPALIRQWALAASTAARRVIAAPPQPGIEAVAWHADIEYSKQVDAYCDYALYSLILQTLDLDQRLELFGLLKSHSPASTYLPHVRPQLFIAYQQAGHHGRALALAEEEIKANTNNADMLLYAAGKAYEKQDRPKATLYSKRLIETLPSKPAPTGMSDGDWARDKAGKLGLAHWMLGMLASNEQRWADADAHLRAALPNVNHNKPIAAETLYHLGIANHRIGDAKNDKNRIIDSIRFNQQCATLGGNFQAQARQNAISLRSQYHIQ